jgi:hypothetical protein
MKERNLNLSNFEEIKPMVIENYLKNVPKIQKDNDDSIQMRL